MNYCWLLNHQVWKQKGEEYRIYGGSGWMWSSHMPQSKSFKRKCLDRDNFPAKKRKLVQVADKIVAQRDTRLRKIQQEELKEKARAPQTTVQPTTSTISGPSSNMSNVATITLDCSTTTNAVSQSGSSYSASSCTTVSSSTVVSGSVNVMTSATSTATAVVAATKSVNTASITSSCTATTPSTVIASTGASLGIPSAIRAITSSGISDSVNTEKVTVAATLTSPVTSVTATVPNVAERLENVDSTEKLIVPLQKTVSTSTTNTDASTSCVSKMLLPSMSATEVQLSAAQPRSSLKTISSAVTLVVQSLPMSVCSATNSVSAVVVDHHDIKNTIYEAKSSSAVQHDSRVISNVTNVSTSCSPSKTLSLVSSLPVVLEACGNSSTITEKGITSITSTFSSVSSKDVKPVKVTSTPPSSEGSTNNAKFQRREELADSTSLTGQIDISHIKQGKSKMQSLGAISNAKSSALVALTSVPNVDPVRTTCVTEERLSVTSSSSFNIHKGDFHSAFAGPSIKSTFSSSMDKLQENVKSETFEKNLSNEEKTSSALALSPQTDDSFETLPCELPSLHNDSQTKDRPKELTSFIKTTLVTKPELQHICNSAEYCFDNEKVDSCKNSELESIESKPEISHSLSETVLLTSASKETKVSSVLEENKITKLPNELEDGTLLITNAKTPTLKDLVTENGKGSNVVMSKNDLDVDDKTTLVKREARHNVIDDVCNSSVDNGIGVNEESVDAGKISKGEAIGNAISNTVVSTESFLALKQTVLENSFSRSCSESTVAKSVVQSNICETEGLADVGKEANNTSCDFVNLGAKDTAVQKQLVVDSTQSVQTSHSVTKVRGDITATLRTCNEPEKRKSQQTEGVSGNDSKLPSKTALGESEVPLKTALGESEVPSKTSLGESEVPSTTALGESEVLSETGQGESEFPSKTVLGEAQNEVPKFKDDALKDQITEKDFSFSNEDNKEVESVSYATPFDPTKDQAREEAMDVKVLSKESKDTALPVVSSEHSMKTVVMNSQPLLLVTTTASVNEEDKAFKEAIRPTSVISKNTVFDSSTTPRTTMEKTTESTMVTSTLSEHCKNFAFSKIETEPPSVMKQIKPQLSQSSDDITKLASSVLRENMVDPVSNVNSKNVDSLETTAQSGKAAQLSAVVSTVNNIKPTLQAVTLPSTLSLSKCASSVTVQTSSITSAGTSSNVTLPTNKATLKATVASVKASVPLATVSNSPSIQPTNHTPSVGTTVKVSSSPEVKVPIGTKIAQPSASITQAVASVAPKLATIIQKPILPSGILAQGLCSTAGSTQPTVVNFMISSTAGSLASGSVVQTFMISTPQGMVQLQGVPMQASALPQGAQAVRTIVPQAAQQGQAGRPYSILPSSQAPNQINIPLMQGANVKLDTKTVVQGSQAVGSTAPVRSIAALVASISTTNLQSQQSPTIHFVTPSGGSLTLQGAAGVRTATPIRPVAQAVSGPVTLLSTQQAKSLSVMGPKTVALSTPKSSVTVLRSQQQPALAGTQSTKPVSRPVKHEEKFPMLRPVLRDPRKLIDCNLARWPRRHSVVNIFRLEKHLLKSLGRKAGMKEVKGFLYNTKGVGITWPASFPRPSFKVGWRYRTRSLKTLAGAGLQCRILHSCLKWEEMNVRPPRSNSTTLFTSTGRL